MGAFESEETGELKGLVYQELLKKRGCRVFRVNPGRFVRFPVFLKNGR